MLQIQVLLQILELFLSRLERGGGVWAQHLKVRVRVPGKSCMAFKQVNKAERDHSGTWIHSGICVIIGTLGPFE